MFQDFINMFTSVKDASADNIDASSASSMLSNFAPLVLIIVIFYFLLIKPQQKKLKEHKNMVNNLSKGDKVLTAGGIIATVVKVNDDGVVVVEIAKDVRIHVRKDTITEVVKSETHEIKNIHEKHTKKVKDDVKSESAITLTKSNEDAEQLDNDSKK